MVSGLLLLHPFFLGGGAGGGGGLLGAGVGLGVTPLSSYLSGGFRLEGGGFGTLTIFQLNESSFGRDFTNSTIANSKAGIKILQAKRRFQMPEAASFKAFSNDLPAGEISVFL